MPPSPADMLDRLEMIVQELDRTVDKMFDAAAEMDKAAEKMLKAARLRRG